MIIQMCRGAKDSISRVQLDRFARAAMTKQKASAPTLIALFIEKALEWRWLAVCHMHCMKFLPPAHIVHPPPNPRRQQTGKQTQPTPSKAKAP